MGLAIGAGFYECTVVGLLLMFTCVKVFPKVENFMISNSRNLSLYVELRSMQDISRVTAQIRENHFEIQDMELEKNRAGDGLGAVYSLRLPKKVAHAQAIAALSEVDCIQFINEL